MPHEPDRRLFAADALLPEGWAKDVRIAFAPDGTIAAVEAGAAPHPSDERANGPVVPALANLHSHAFQRVMAGLAEVSGPVEDTFWTWRETMYRIAGTIAPADMQAIAARLYVDMLKCGTAHVGEFHYLHNDVDGRPYARRTETAEALIAAARASGIAMTLLPAFYAHGDFGGAPPSEGQRRFVNDIDGFLRLVSELRPVTSEAGVRLGYAFHSLRAATPDEMRAILAAKLPGPVHIHVAEQRREVEGCLRWSGRTPVSWLLDEMPVDAGWCLIHATHSTGEEIARIAGSDATVGLCPTTEGSLGDGIFPATAFRAAGGFFGIGSDSQVSTDPAEELRLLEYGQRLRDERRLRLTDGPARSNGRDLFAAALAGGARALGDDKWGIAAGAPARLTVLDDRHPFIAAAEGDTRLDRWIFALGGKAVRDVMVDGTWRIRDGRHPRDEEIDGAFAAAVTRLAAA